MTRNEIIIKSSAEIEGIRQASLLVAEFLDERLPKIIKPGLSTAKIDELADEFTVEKNVRASFKDVDGYFHATCTSVNEEVVHAIPGNRVVQEGDIVKVDFGVTREGFIGDACRTYLVGPVKPRIKALVKATEEALYLGIEQALVGQRIGDIGSAIQRHVERKGFSVVREYVGHGVGKALHEGPNIPHYGHKGTGVVLEEGMVIAIEPMINVGTWRTKVLSDGWTVVTMDGKCSAQFEHTVAITRSGPQILSLKS